MSEIPDVVVNPSNGFKFAKGKFLGKGGFARCYEFTNIASQEIFAAKIVSKTLLQKRDQKDKMAQEVQIHRALNHPHIVQFNTFFEDTDNVYVLLELCPRRSMMELHRRRKVVTEPEARYFTLQIVRACEYLYSRHIIHRDLKLGNLFLNDDMRVKVGDFGLATIVEFDGQRKKTLCGTPNYIAPEMLDNKGHSYEVDIWALGCILYTLLVGNPPFQTESLKETYHKIKTNSYTIPARVGIDAGELITRLLAADPSRRPTINEVAEFGFFTRGYTPSRLPTSCLILAPKFTPAQLSQGSRRALSDASDHNLVNPRERVRLDLMNAPVRHLVSVPECEEMPSKHAAGDRQGDVAAGETAKDSYLADLYTMLTEFINKKPNERLVIQEDEAQDPAATPVYWVSKWVDYSDKYGLGYQLCDSSVGVIFNDNTKMVINADGVHVQYTERDNTEKYFTVTVYPPELTKKITLLTYFRGYMNEHLLEAGANMGVRECEELARLPFLRTWFRTRSAIVLYMSNGALQINFFQDHTKLIVCPLMGAATYIDQNRRFRVLKFSLLEKYGCSTDVFARVKYARTMVERMLAQSSKSRPLFLSTATTCGRLQSGVASS